jgi:hypothetical protein
MASRKLRCEYRVGPLGDLRNVRLARGNAHALLAPAPNLRDGKVLAEMTRHRIEQLHAVGLTVGEERHVQGFVPDHGRRRPARLAHRLDHDRNEGQHGHIIAHETPRFDISNQDCPCDV